MRNSSIHAAAVVIADRPLTDIVPLQLADAGTDENGEQVFRTVTQFSMKPIEEIGLLKMDFLGLRNLDVIEDALDIIERSTGRRGPDMTTLPLDDPRTYEMLARGDSIGRVPVRVRGHARGAEEGAPRRVQRPRRAQRALPAGRDGPDPGVRARASATPRRSPTPTSACAPILESSKGVILYQEQAMQISKELAGFSGAKADDLRKAIGKKNREAMAALKPEFVEGCRASGTSAEVIELLWQTNEKSADYSFNKSHAACYALIAYRTAWLKANHPAEYMAALISSVMSTKDKVPFFVARCEEMGIEILPPDVNLSDHEFIGRRAATSASAWTPSRASATRRSRRSSARARRAAPFTSLWDFCERVDSRAVNKKAIEALIKCGALGSTGATPQGHARGARAGPGRGPEGPAGRADRPGLDLRPRPARRRGRPGRVPRSQRCSRPSHPPIPAEEFEQAELLAVEKEAIGLFISAHPLKPLREALRARADCPLAALAERRDKDWVTVGGIITEAKRIRTRNGDHDDVRDARRPRGGRRDARLRQGAGRARGGARVDQVVLVRGRVDHKEAGKTCVVVQSVEPFAPSEQEIAERARPAPRPPRRTAPPRWPSRVHCAWTSPSSRRQRDRGRQAR